MDSLKNYLIKPENKFFENHRNLAKKKKKKAPKNHFATQLNELNPKISDEEAKIKYIND